MALIAHEGGKINVGNFDRPDYTAFNPEKYRISDKDRAETLAARLYLRIKHLLKIEDFSDIQVAYWAKEYMANIAMASRPNLESYIGQL